MAVSSAAVKDYAGRGASAGWGILKGAANVPVRVAEGERVSIIPNWMRKAFTWIIKFILGLTIIALVVLGLIAGYNYYQSGLGASQITHAEVAVQETGAPVLAKLGLTTAYNAIFNPAALTPQYGFESDIEQSQSDPDLGVKITDLKQIGLPHYGEPVELLAAIKAKSPEDNLKLVVNCKLGDGDIIPATVSSSQSSGNEATLFKDQLEVMQASCVFPKGIEPEKITLIKPGQRETPPVKASKEAVVYAAFEFKTKASHTTYFMNSKELNAILQMGEEPFSLYKIKDPQLKSDRTIRSKTTSGPINLGIGTAVSQPFVESHTYSFGVSISNNIDWHGNMKKLETLNIEIPPFLYLEGESGFGEKQFVSTCAFDSTGQKSEDGFKIYTLKESLIAQTNRECGKETLESSTLTEQQCIDLFGKDKDTTFWCSFKQPESPMGTGLQYDFIRAEAKYIYQTEKKTAVDAIVRPETVIGIV